TVSIPPRWSLRINPYNPPPVGARLGLAPSPTGVCGLHKKGAEHGDRLDALGRSLLMKAPEHTFTAAP
ncbi:MAG: hypothetical protein ACREDD_13695, partial [Methylocella sp.]